jgi:hypothetical protein
VGLVRLGRIGQGIPGQWARETGMEEDEERRRVVDVAEQPKLMLDA